ncbi:MAG: carboxylating nicotinate-nucleotide diphosphorylase [Acidimicrobiia bacterium]
MNEYDPPIQAVRDAVARALSEDLGPLGDITAALLPEGALGSATFVARAAGVLAGTACVEETYAQLDDAVRVTWALGDGATLETGALIGRLDGRLRSLLTGERTALNFLCHLSGVATLTRRFVEAAARRAQIWDTRKTLPGLRALQKAAVRAGGGANHRGSLSEMVLVKDNHLGSLGVTGAVKQARESWPGRRVEVECDHADQVLEAVTAGADMVMLDNMTPAEAADCVRLVREGTRPDTLVEVSGGITLENVADYAGTGADLISTSAITQSAPALDIGLDVAPRANGP